MAVTFYAVGELIKKGKNVKEDFAIGNVRVKLYNDSEEDGMTLERFATVVEGEGEYHPLNASDEKQIYLARDCKYEDGVFEVRDSKNTRIYKVRDDVAQSFAKSARISDGGLKTLANRNIEKKKQKSRENISA